MKIMIGGGFNEAEPETRESVNIKLFGEALARAAIEQGHSLVLGHLTQFDRAVIDAGWAALTDKESDEYRVRSWRSISAPLLTDSGSRLNSKLKDWKEVGTKLRYPEPIYEADVIILIGGWEGARTARTWANIAKRTVFPVASFGLASQEIYDDSLDELITSCGTGIDPSEFDILNMAVDELSEEQAQKFGNRIISLAEKAMLSRDVFIVMSYRDDEKLNEAYKAFTEACDDCKFQAIRLDKLETGETYKITDTIKENLKSCAFAIVDLTDNRPNVYYELGFLQALDKRVILTKQKGTESHFDVQDLNTIEWMGFVDARDKVRDAVTIIAKDFGS